jgi:DNA-directed RNA polymerase subunit F
MLLAPTGSKSLEGIGEMIGIPKVKDVTRDQKRNMIGLMKSNFELFEEYALKDAEIARKYVEEVIEISTARGGKPQIPVTLTSLGISFVIDLTPKLGHIKTEVRMVLVG